MPQLKSRSRQNITRRLARLLPLSAAVAAAVGRPLGAQAAPSGPLAIFHAGSLTYPIRKLLDAYRAIAPGVEPRTESSGSVEAVRKVTDLGKIPDVVATADYAVIERLLMPKHARWYATFASNAMEVAYSDRSAGATDITAANWIDVLTRPGIRIGRSNPALDPSGYRALMVFQLAERYYRRPGLARRLEANSPPAYTRPKEVELIALVETGELDYAVFYRSMVGQTGLRSIRLPPEIDLSDAARKTDYATARVVIPRTARGTDSLVFTGEPIVYALTVPAGAPNPVAARSFVRFVLSDRGRAILVASGFVVPAKPAVVGDTVEAGRWVR